VTTFQDCSIGLLNESTYKTFVAPTRFLEFTDENLGWDKNVKQGAGLRVGGRVARSARRVVPTAAGKGDFTVEVPTKGMGLLWQAALGTGVSTLVSGSTYQQNFTLGDTPNSLTIQKGIPQVGGTVDAYSFLGSMISGFELDCPNGDIVTAKFTVDAGDLSTAQAYATPSYAASFGLFHFAQGVLNVNGTLTAPTTTTLGSVASPIAASIRAFNVKVDHNLAVDRYNYGGAGRKSKPSVGLRDITGRITIEYDQTTLRDAFLNDTDVQLVLTFTGAALSTGNETLQIILPCVRLEGDLPQASPDLITVDCDFRVLDNLTAAQPIWIIHRTADTAL
jgi:hypothetical protein